MPKIIEGLEEIILTAAEALFIHQGYHRTDMREIARNTDIAVGTIYHYYKDKETLYYEVIQRIWSRTIERMEAVYELETDPAIILKKMLQIFIEDMAGKPLRDLWDELAALHVNKSTHKPDIHEGSIHARFAGVFSRVLADMAGGADSTVNQAKLERLGSFVFVMAVDICLLPEEERTDNIDLIVDLVQPYLLETAG